MKINSKKNLSDILEIDKIEIVKNKISHAHGLPNECYISDEYLNYERNKIFCGNWSVIGTASSIPEVGDVKSYDLLGIPLIILSIERKS